MAGALAPAVFLAVTKFMEPMMNQAKPRERVPRGQVLTKKWPVLTYGETPRADLARWTFHCFGSVQEPVSWTWQEFLQLPRVEITSDVHCVTRWSRLDNRWEGVAVSEILRRVRLLPEAVAVMVHADPDYTTNLLLTDLLGDDVLLALKHDGGDLPPEHGGPCRLVVPGLYFWKSAKWVRGFEFLGHNAPGFWEENGYHMRADPWKEERYSAQETDAMQRMRAESARRRRAQNPN
jgi:DMSO/TMAO reductase YedYZ molybdopterin-dependent catalytic subunit